MDKKAALEILKNRKEDYLVPNSDIDEAIDVAISVLEEKINKNIIIELCLKEDGEEITVDINKLENSEIADFLMNIITVNIVDEINSKHITEIDYNIEGDE